VTTPPEDDGPGRYRSGGEDMRAVRESLAELRTMRTDDRALRARLIKWVIGVAGSALLAGGIPTVKMLIDVGAISEQQRAMRADVTQMLTVTSTLVRDGETTRAKLDESARDRAALHESLRSVETKLWEMRQRRSGGTDGQ
jgi:hypothetical protein